MNRLAHKQMNKSRRANRVRTAVVGTSARPRLSVHVSNMHVSAQIIDDSSGKTLAYSTSISHQLTGTMSDKAEVVGKEIAAKAKKTKVSRVVFDRGARIYHGRVKTLADAARQNGLEF